MCGLLLSEGVCSSVTSCVVLFECCWARSSCLDEESFMRTASSFRGRKMQLGSRSSQRCIVSGTSCFLSALLRLLFGQQGGNSTAVQLLSAERTGHSVHEDLWAPTGQLPHVVKWLTYLQTSVHEAMKPTEQPWNLINACGLFTCSSHVLQLNSRKAVERLKPEASMKGSPVIKLQINFILQL